MRHNRNYNISKAAQQLPCNETCLNFIADAGGKAIFCRLNGPASVKRPGDSSCECHSLKGYTGGMGRPSQAMKYAEKYAEIQKLEMQKKDSKNREA